MNSQRLEEYKAKMQQYEQKQKLRQLRVQQKQEMKEIERRKAYESDEDPSKAAGNSLPHRSIDLFIEEEDPPPAIPTIEEFDEKAAREKTIERYKKMKRIPGKPIIVPSLSFAPEEFSDYTNCTPDEQNRRREIENAQVMKIR